LVGYAARNSPVSEGPNDRGPAKPSTMDQTLRTRGSHDLSSRLSRMALEEVHNLYLVTTPGRDGERSSLARRAGSDESRHATLTLQGSRGQQSPRPGQTPSLCHAAPMRQHRAMMTTGTTPTVQIRTDKMYVQFHPLRDGIHDEGLSTEAL
jgi:hypothetical protein